MRKLRNTLTLGVFLGVFVGLFALSPLAAGPASGFADSDGADLETLLSTLRANKKAFIAVNLPLTDAEAAAFWPVYDRYQADLNVMQERLLAVIGEYAAGFATVSDEQAVDLVDRYLMVERDRAQARRRYREAIAAALPGRKMLRFYQIENKIDALRRFELAATIPVID